VGAHRTEEGAPVTTTYNDLVRENADLRNRLTLATQARVNIAATVTNAASEAERDELRVLLARAYLALVDLRAKGHACSEFLLEDIDSALRPFSTRQGLAKAAQGGAR